MPLEKPTTGVATQKVQLDQIEAIHEQTQILKEQTLLLREIHSMLLEQIEFLKGPTLGNR